MTSKVMQNIFFMSDFMGTWLHLFFYTQNIYTMFKFKQMWICWASVILNFSQVIKTFTTFISTSLTMLMSQSDVTQTVTCIGRFSEAGLLEWMRFVIFRARSRSALPGRFLSRRCFMLCTIVEVEPRIAKQYKCQYCCSCKIYRGKGMEGEKKCLLSFFWLSRRSRVRRKNAFGASCSTGNKLLLIARHITTMGLQKCL